MAPVLVRAACARSGPRSASSAVGVDQCATTSFSGRALWFRSCALSVPLPSRACGLGHAATVSSSRQLVGSAARSGLPAPRVAPALERAVGHREDEQALALLREAALRRREQSDLTRPTKALQLSDHDVGAEGEVAADVLQEHGPGPGLDEDAPDVGPQVAGVGGGEAAAGEAERLAGVARNEEVHASAPRAAAEGSGIAPHRARSQEARLHRLDQDCGGEGLPLHHADRASAWTRQLDGEVQSPASGADGEDVEGVGVGLAPGM